MVLNVFCDSYMVSITVMKQRRNFVLISSYLTSLKMTWEQIKQYDLRHKIQSDTVSQKKKKH